MGSGKTTLGRLMAEERGWPFVDLDEEIATLGGRSVAEVWRTDGEEAFRDLELRVLQDVARQCPPDLVLATGGGVVETPEAAASLRLFDTIVWLRADPDLCVSRLGPTRADRPLLDDTGVWQQRWRRRRPLYEALAHVVIDTGDCPLQASLAALQQAVDAPPGRRRPEDA